MFVVVYDVMKYLYFYNYYLDVIRQAERKTQLPLKG